MPSDMPTDGPTFETPIFTEYDADDQTPVCPPDCEDPDASAGPLCGNGIVEDGEQCDDGNARPGDGCSGVCRLEANYACPVPGMDCVSTIVCGDGKISGGEACDDGNTTNGDGCSALCEVESGYACTQPGMLCTPVTMNMGYCGDGMVNAGETCDDGNTVGNDGCSATCQHESGWTCAMPGAMCVRDEYCGDGKLNGDEECDDGNLLPGDGCTGTCKQEPFFTCPVPGMACASTIVCGDGLVVGDEACDDGNTMGGDGCAADCKQVEAGYTCPTAFGVGGVCTAVPMDICGDGRLSYGEFCDDGNMVGGDGCSGDCKVEAGYTCGDPGTACTLVGWCGDGKLSLADGEQCDDDNDVGGDGCSSQCLIEANYVCPEPGTLCTSTVVCGDGRITGSEQCDDGNAVGADGCSATCQIETGWTCLSPGRACRATFCGDGIKVGAEQCDDGNTNNADGCSADCKLETPADNERDGWICNTPGMSCTRTTCGNGMREGSEQCDDGNNNTGDGCTPFCRREPICPTAGGACSTACGDGLLLASDIAAGQECDDGNTVSGDGCSSTCKIEQGYECTTITIHPNPLILPIVYRDFKGLGLEGSNEHPDFQNAVIQTAKPLGEPGVVKPILGANGKPVHIDGQTESTVNNQPGYDSQNWFSYWFQDTSGITQTVLETLTFTRLMTGEYQFNSGSGFFPLNERGWGNYVNSGINCTVETPRNFHFTSELRYWFEYQGNERLDFVGDDDLWVFINKRLTIDLGGLHPVNTGNVILHANNGTGAVCDFLTQEPVWPPPSTCTSYRTVDLGLELGKVYEIVVFHAERYTCGSNYHLTLANFSGQRSQCGPVCGDGFVTPDEACDLGAVHNTGAYGTCNADCSLPARCGDGMVDASNGEACDNGINSATYGGNAQLCGPECQIAPYCGDGMVDSANGEACDDGIDNGRGYGFCSATCQLGPRCGDGTVSDGEECDDGVVLNGTSGSLCMSNCLLKCGNGVMDPGEACDDGKVNNVGGYGKCSPLCQLGPRCGDGIKNGNEECDDGKNDGTYGTCAPGCVFGPRCGDAVVQTPAGEQCDAGNANQADPYGEEMCNTRCQWAPYCGDKAVDVSKGEQCDDGVNDGTPGSCTTDCSGAVPLPSCGDGTRQDPEQCDDGANNGTAGSTCDIHCRWKCGNGFKDPGEACDDGVNNGSYGTCNANCTLAPHCGDGVKNGPEQCDLGTGNETNPYGSSKCSSLCTTAPYCGDGRIQSAFGEECEPPSVGCGSMCKFQAID